MYNPSRGGVRGGADQFTWESVKNDKHRENYLGHSLKAPVGRWQKGKDLSWYAKERKDADGAVVAEKSELSAIKRAEEEAMLIALGHNIVRKESQTLTKEEMKEALKRNVGERDELNIERVDGLGASSRRTALLSGAVKDSKSKTEGVAFESQQPRIDDKFSNEKKELDSSKKKKSKKKSKKHKKEKKYKKHVKDSLEYGESNNSMKHKERHKKVTEYNSEESDRSPPKRAKGKKSKHKHKHHSVSSNSESDSKNHKKRIISHGDSSSSKRHRHDTSESD